MDEKDNLEYKRYSLTWTVKKIQRYYRFFLERLAFFCPELGMRRTLHRLRGVKIGKGVYLGSDVLIDRVHPELVVIEDNAIIGDRCIITAHSNLPSKTRLRKIYPRMKKEVRICEGAWIPPGVIILPGVTIGREAVVGAGSVVTKDIPAGCVAVGAPAKVIKDLSEELEKIE